MTDLRCDTLSRLLASERQRQEPPDWRLLLLLEQRAPWSGWSRLDFELFPAPRREAKRSRPTTPGRSVRQRVLRTAITSSEYAE